MRKGRVEPLLEGGDRLEDVWEEEVEQGPHLWQAILEWRAGQQESVWRYVMRVEHLCESTVVILHSVAFVDDHVLPLQLPYSHSKINYP